LTVPNDDWLCRFVKEDDWNYEDRRPFPIAFRASGRKLSLWHVDRVEQTGCPLQDLCINALVGAGEAHLRTGDCIDAATDVDSPVFDPQVFWRPDAVEPDWATWQLAHVHIEAVRGDASFPHTYRVALVLRANPVRPPLESK